MDTQSKQPGQRETSTDKERALHLNQITDVFKDKQVRYPLLLPLFAPAVVLRVQFALVSDRFVVQAPFMKTSEAAKSAEGPRCFSFKTVIMLIVLLVESWRIRLGFLLSRVDN